MTGRMRARCGPHLVACERMVGRQESCLGDDVEVGERRLDHKDVGTFLDVSDLRQGDQQNIEGGVTLQLTMARLASPLAFGGS